MTIGLKPRDSQQNGVYWSLPLACLRYYGDPVVASCSVNSNEESRLTVEELSLSIVGCFLGGWGVAEPDTSRAIKWLAQIADILNEAVKSNYKEAKAMIIGEAASSWFNLLLSTARIYQRSSDDERQAPRRLVSLGRKDGKSFLGLPKCSFFGLTNRGRFVGIMGSEDEQIRFLRGVAREVQATAGFEYHHLFIRYKHRCRHSSKVFYEFATALPLLRNSIKRDADAHWHQSRGHCRWLYAGEKVPQNDFHDKSHRSRLEQSNEHAGKEYVAELLHHCRENAL